MSTIVERIKQTLDIEEVYRDLAGQPTSKGRSQQAVRCPMPDHEDTNPSATLNRAQNLWYCHRCDVGGSVIDLVMNTQAKPFVDAVDWLIERYRVNAEDWTNGARENLKKKHEQAIRIREAMGTFVKRCHGQLTEKHRKHLRSRGLTDETIDDLLIGFEPRTEPVKPDKAKTIGAMGRNETYLAAQRYIIPVRNHEQIVYWLGYQPDGSPSKYIKPRTTNDVLEAPLWVNQSDPQEDPLYVVEGVFDQLAMIEANHSSVCLLGTTVSDRPLDTLRRLATHQEGTVQLMLDNDEAGQSGARALAEELWPEVQAEMVQYPGGVSDPNELLVNAGKTSRFRNQLKQLDGKTILQHRLEQVQSATEKQAKLNHCEHVYPLLAGLSEVEQDLHLKQLRKQLDKAVRLSVMRNEVKRAAQKQTKDGPNRFFNQEGRGKSFVPSRLGQHLLEETPYLYTGERLYRYHEGYFEPDGEEYLHRRMQDVLGEEWTTRHAREVRTWIEQKTRTDEDELQPETTLINVRNGMLELETLDLDEHDPSTKSLIQHPVNFDPDVTVPRVDDFVREVVTDECEELIWDFLGYCLIRPLELKKCLILTGRGDNGKSVLLKTVFENILGPAFVAHESLQSLSENRFSTAQLFGKAANIHSDLEAREVQQTGLFKQLTGGDTIRAERKHKDTFHFTNTARLLFSANELPAVKDFNEAFFNRLVIVRCPNQFKGDDADPRIEEKLSTPEAQSHILNRGLEGAQRLLERQRFEIPGAVNQAVHEYQAKADSVTGFLQAHTEPVDEQSDTKGISKDRMYATYRVWCRQSGYHAVGKNKFGRRAKGDPNHLTDFYPTQSSLQKEGSGTRQVHAWKGIQLKDDLVTRFDTQIVDELEGGRGY